MEEFKTTDIILAACLKLNEKEIIRIDISGNKGIFVFTDVDVSFVDEYDLGKCKVEPISFNNMIKQLTTSVRRMNDRK